MIKRLIGLGLLTLVLLGFESCKQHHTPKARGYYRINFPEKEYVGFEGLYPYKFDYPKYATVVPDTSANAEKYWINIYFKELNGQIHISYKKVDGNFNQLMEDSRKLAYKHTIKADAINERMFYDENSRVTGVLYEIKGDAASPMQFFATDSLEHFIRGSLYFNAIPNQDSLAPVINFVHQDVIRLMESLRWK